MAIVVALDEGDIVAFNARRESKSSSLVAAPSREILAFSGDNRQGHV
jgi:hypothetical protein